MKRERLHISRPVRRPGETEYRRGLARDLSRSGGVVQWEKSKRLLNLPMLSVAMEGYAGVEFEEHMAQRRARMAA